MKSRADSVCGGGGGGLGFSQSLHFHVKFWINLINLGYHIYLEYSDPLFSLIYNSQQVNFTTYECV